MLAKDVGICIRAVDYSETSQVVTFFTRDGGKVALMAKGSKRLKSAFGGAIEMLSCGHMVYTEPRSEGLATLTELDVDYGRTNPAKISSDLYVLHCCLLAVELLDKFTNDHDPHPELFDRFVEFVGNMCEVAGGENVKRDALSLLIVFELWLLKEVGLRPVLDRCANCGAAAHSGQRGYYFSSGANGVVCRDCENSFPDKTPISTKAAGCLSQLGQIAEASERTLVELERILVNHFTELLHRPPKMAKHVLRG